MNIGIIGKGTASIITTLVLLQRGHNITILYDPDTQPINVGESTTPHIQELLYEVLGLSIGNMVDKGIFSYKMGINFVNWGKGKSFHHHFNGPISTAHHFETKPFNDFIHKHLEENKIVNYIPEKINHIVPEDDTVRLNDHTFDFVVNCAGWKNGENYITPFFQTVNSAQLFVDNQDCPYYEDLYTMHLATEDGWQFGLPFPNLNVFKCGYLYDKNQISHEDVTEKLKKSNKKVHSTFSWEPKYSKELIVHKRLALNGNILFFFEPLQALSLLYFYYSSIHIADYLDNFCMEKLDNCNYSYNVDMWAYQLSLAYHYQYGSIHDTEFWRKVTKEAKQIMSSSLNGNLDIRKMNWERDCRFKDKEQSYSQIGSFHVEDLKQIHYGMTTE